MRFDIDYDFAFEYDKEADLPILPNGLEKDERGLYKWPNGKYLPPDAYILADGSKQIIYEPRELEFQDLL